VLQDGDRIVVPPRDRYLPHVVVSGAIAAPPDQPGPYVVPIASGDTLGTLFRAGPYGLGPEADPTHVQLKRAGPDGAPTRQLVNLQAIWDGGLDVELRDRDEILVPGRDVYAPQITIRGEFRGVGVYAKPEAGLAATKEGTYAIAEGEPVSQVVTSIGGVTPSGTPERIYLQRNENGLWRLIQINLTAIAAGTQKDEPLHGGDLLEAPAQELFAEKVTLVGEFASAYEHGTGTTAVSTARPGAAPRTTITVRRGERIRDVVQLAGGATPDASLAEAYIVRPKPDGTVERLPVDLFSVLVYPDSDRGQEMNLAVQGGDELWLPRIEDSIYFVGSVGRQGPVAYQPGRRFSHYLAMAGGRTERAKLSQVVISRRGAEGRQPIVIDGRKALAGDLAEDIVLQPGDVVVIGDIRIHGFADLLRTLTQATFLLRFF